MSIRTRITLIATTMLLLTGAGLAAGGRDAILATLLVEAKQDDPGFTSFSAARGEAFYQAQHTGGHAETPSCTTCHTTDPRNTGHTRAGKEIDPVAVSLTPTRFTDADKVAKWFRRNCRSVLGRDCTAAEKGDYITYLINQ